MFNQEHTSYCIIPSLQPLYLTAGYFHHCHPVTYEDPFEGRIEVARCIVSRTIDCVVSVAVHSETKDMSALKLRR